MITARYLHPRRQPPRVTQRCESSAHYEAAIRLLAVELYSVEGNPVDGQAGRMSSKSPLPSLPNARKRVAANIRHLRKAKGLSQEQLAEIAEFHRTYVSQLERCVTNISIDGLERLAQVLGVDITDLLQVPEHGKR